MLIMCQHVCSAIRLHKSGCAYHVPACVQCYANILSGRAYHVPACVQCYANALERVFFLMCQHVRSAMRTHLSGCAYHVPAGAQCYANILSGCAYHVPACAQCYANTLERVCLSCASMYAVLRAYTGAGALITRQHARSARPVHLSECAYHINMPACVQC